MPGASSCQCNKSSRCAIFRWSLSSNMTSLQGSEGFRFEAQTDEATPPPRPFWGGGRWFRCGGLCLVRAHDHRPARAGRRGGRGVGKAAQHADVEQTTLRFCSAQAHRMCFRLPAQMAKPGDKKKIEVHEA